MTERLYYDDAYLTRFEANIVDRGCDPCEVYLDRTAFYPTSGGQPFDRGWIGEVPVIDVVDEGELIRHLLSRPLNQSTAECRIDWDRRFDFMQQHTGQHLLSAVFAEFFHADTVGVHLGEETSTFDLNIGSLTAGQQRDAEARANELVFANLPVTVTYESAADAIGLRKASDRSGELRIISIEGHDRSACGGTHVRATGEIGLISLRRTDKVRGSMRVEFLCGRRAVRRARADFEAIEACAQVFSAAVDDTPQLVAAQQDKLVASEKNRQRLEREAALARGRQLYRETEPGAGGVRIRIQRLNGTTVDDASRAEAQSFTSEPKAVLAILSPDPPVALLAASADSGFHAGNVLRELLAKVGGRGGGNDQLAQGKLPSSEAVDRFAELLEARLTEA